MIYYLGFPLEWPDGEIFGTICVLDSKQNDEATAYKALMTEFRHLVQGDLKIILQGSELKKNTEQLEQFNQILVARESRIISIKQEVNKLSLQLGTAEPYPEIWKEES